MEGGQGCLWGVGSEARNTAIETGSSGGENVGGGDVQVFVEALPVPLGPGGGVVEGGGGWGEGEGAGMVTVPSHSRTHKTGEFCPHALPRVLRYLADRDSGSPRHPDGAETLTK